MNILKPHGSRTLPRLYLLVLIAILIQSPVFSLTRVTEARLATHGRSGIVLFPDHQVKDFKIEATMPEIITADFYDWEFVGGSAVVPAPHHAVKFMKVSQVSRKPNVVRAVLVLNQPMRYKPKVLNNNLVLEPVGQPRRTATTIGDTHAAFNARHSALPATYNTVLDQRITLEFEQEDLMTILNALSVKFNLRVFADSGVKGRYSVHAEDVTLRDVLKNLLLQRNFQYTLKGRDLTIISLGTQSGRMARELLFRDLSLRDALQTLSKMMNINLIIHESVEDKNVNFYVENLSLDELLDLLVSTNNLVKKPHNDNTFVILNRESANEFGERHYRTFKLVDAKPDEVVKMISGSRALSEKIDTANFSINERINALSVYDTKENLALIEQIVKSVDEKVKQAVIEVKLVEVNRSSLRELGIRLMDGASTIPAGETADGYSLQVPNIGHLPSSAALPAKISMLEESDGAKVLASPKIRAVHMKPARIFIGRTVPIPYYDYATATGTSNQLVAQGQTLKRYRDVEVGIELNVTPEISRDNEISIDLETEIKSMEGEPNEDGQYSFSTKSTRTHVRIKDGETIVLGGLISHENRSLEHSPALINRIPLLRTLFTNKRTTFEEREMIMLVTPRLVNLDHDDDPDIVTDGSRITSDDIFSSYGNY